MGSFSFGVDNSSLHVHYYGQNVGWTIPDVTLTGDPSVDQPALLAAGYISGRIMALKTSNVAGRGTVIVPCDTEVLDSPSSHVLIPFGTLINGGGEYATSIGPSGSKKAPVVRAMWEGSIGSNAYNPADVINFVVGQPLYCGNGATAGMYCAERQGADSTSEAVAICTYIPTTANPRLGIASLL